MAINNVMISLGLDRAAATDIVRRSVTRFGPMFIEVLRFPILTPTNIHEYVTIANRHLLDEVYSLGKGVILATSHSGNWELLGAADALNGFPIAAVAQKQTNVSMDKFMNELRSCTGMHVTYKTGVKEMVSLLTKGWGIGLLLDQDAQQHGVFVDFFGRPASTAQGAATLARMKGAPILPAFITSNGDGTHTILLSPPVWVTKTEDRDADVLKTTQELTTIIETHIRAHPQEWFWLHNRWKTAPLPKQPIG
jgi:KDO2-lipid IV(A) lauroyltransferase